MNPSDQARQVGVVDSWLGHYRPYGAIANPVGAQIICDTGQMAGGYYDIMYQMSATVAIGAGLLFFSWRNAANSAYIFQDYFHSAVANSKRGFLKGVKVAQGERFRVEAGGAVTGSLTGGIIAVRRA